MSDGADPDGRGGASAAAARPSARGGDPFPFHHGVEVRFRDLDPMGHAHHTVPLVYFEEARSALWRELTGRSGLDGMDYVIAEATLAYRARIRFPQRAIVAIRVARVGTRSFTLEYELRGADGELLTEGRTVQVMFDYPAGTSKPVPEDLRQGLERLRAASLRAES